MNSKELKQRSAELRAKIEECANDKELSTRGLLFELAHINEQLCEALAAYEPEAGVTCPFVSSFEQTYYSKVKPDADAPQRLHDIWASAHRCGR